MCRMMSKAGICTEATPPCLLPQFSCKTSIYAFNQLRPEQNGHHFADGILKCIFLWGKFCILLQISLKFFPGSPVDPTDFRIANRWQTCIWTNDDLDDGGHMASLGHNELKKMLPHQLYMKNLTMNGYIYVIVYIHIKNSVGGCVLSLSLECPHLEVRTA